jgi:hypothetical protein
MTAFSWFLFFLSVALLWGARKLHRREPAAGHDESLRFAPPPRARPPAAARSASAPAPQRALEQIEWVTPPKALTIPEERRARLRDRYIASRFPGVLRGSNDLLAVEYVIKVGRHYFEEGRMEDAAELFQLAIQQSPAERAFRLALLEITFLAHDGVAFTRLAREMKSACAEVPEWDQIARLGHAIAPEEALFGGAGTNGGDRHYGPWPDMPNWIQASWDLTSEVLASDFHRAMVSRDHDQARQQRAA